MDLSKFIQEDIIDYLEEKSTEQRDQLGTFRSEEITIFSIEKDYAKETEKALLEDNFNKAKKIFNELREAYNNNQGNEIEKEKIYAILEEVYTKIKKGLQGKKNLEADLQTFEKGMQSIKEENNNFDTAATEAEEERQIHNTELKKIMNLINLAIEAKDVKQSINEYDKLKKAFEFYPSEDKYRKLEWYNEVLGTYEQIKRLQEKEKKIIKEEKQQKKQEKEKKQEEEKLTKKQLASQHIKQIKDEIKELIQSLDQGDIKKTSGLLIDVKHKVTKLDKEFEKEKTALESILATANNRLVFLQQEQARKKEEETTKEKKKKEKEEKQKEMKEEQKEKEIKQKEAIKGAKNADELYHKGLKYQHKGNAEEAKACFKALLKITPHHLPAQIRLEQIEEGEKHV